jgi:hypothetical protein
MKKFIYESNYEACSNETLPGFVLGEGVEAI